MTGRDAKIVETLMSMVDSARAHVVRQSLSGRHEQDKIDAEEWLARYKDTMSTKKYKVWDALNGEEDFAREVEARYPDDAAQEYAENDKDGHMEGLYELGHPIRVRDPDGELFEIDVQVEMEPRYWAGSPKKIEEST